MKTTFSLLSEIALATVSLATSPADAQKYHGARTTPQQTVMKSDRKPLVEQKRDPADVALDRWIKGICRGC